VIDYLRLVFFNTFIGNSAGFAIIRNEVGLFTAIKLVMKMQIKLLVANPFKRINAKRPHLSWNERSSQKQIAPAFCLYEVLIEEGYSEQDAIAFVEKVVIGVAAKFLAFTIPVISLNDISGSNQRYRLSIFTKLTSRFPNAAGKLDFDGKAEYRFTVNKCLFAYYCNALGYENLANIFCKADKKYFDEHQPQVEFSRNTTLASDQKPCDFAFTIIEERRIEANMITKG